MTFLIMNLSIKNNKKQPVTIDGDSPISDDLTCPETPEEEAVAPEAGEAGD